MLTPNRNGRKVTVVVILAVRLEAAGCVEPAASGTRIAWRGMWRSDRTEGGGPSAASFSSVI